MAPIDRSKQLRSIGEPVLQDLCLQMTETDPGERPTAQRSIQLLENMTESELYKACGPKRMVKGIKTKGDKIQLTDKPWY